jgi:hypothetical protein
MALISAYLKAERRCGVFVAKNTDAAFPPLVLTSSGSKGDFSAAPLPGPLPGRERGKD